MLLSPNVFCNISTVNNKNVNVSNFVDHPGIYFDGLGKINIAKDKWLIICLNIGHNAKLLKIC